ncbi:MAG TPA: O-antigen ligase family protein [Bryobacteraceae bacterium]|nr:O-antigen ligase family protein [Bryobacteraceae bacterium]
MSVLISKIEQASGRIATFTFLVLLGLAAIVGGEVVQVLPRRMAFGALLLLLLFAAALITRRPREIFLAGWVFALVYNRQYFVFLPFVGDQGSEGPYLIASDLFLILLIAYWYYEHSILKMRREPIGRPLWPWYLPFAVVCVISLFVSDRPDWGIYELIRVAKVGFILYYVRRNFRKREWWLCALTLGAAVCFESALGTMEVATKRSGVLGVFGLGQNANVMPERFTGEFSQEVWYGMYRATATMSHPPNLACYLLLTIPVFLALAPVMPRVWQRLACAGTGLLGLVGLACTLSRWPWAVASLQLLLLFAGLVGMRLWDVRRALGVVFLGIILLVSGLIPFRHLIVQRMTRDFKVSEEGRFDEYGTAIEMFGDRPFLGTGLNNARAHIVHYRPEIQYNLDLDTPLTQLLHLRAIVSPQNGFLHVLIELGALGVLTFLVYVVGTLVTGLRAIQESRGYARAACFGLTIGLLGVMLQQAVDFSYWVDPLLYTYTLVVGMLNTSVVLRDGNEPANERALLPVRHIGGGRRVHA